MGDLGEIELYEEIVDGEIVEEREPDIGWIQWWDPDRQRTFFKLYVDQTWYQRASRGLMDELNAYAEGLASVVRRSL